jgi:hypothetical protein
LLAVLAVLACAGPPAGSDKGPWVSPTAGGSPTGLAGNPPTGTGLVFSPDGSELEFLDNNSDLYVVPVAGGMPVCIASNVSLGVFSPDGHTVFFSASLHQPSAFSVPQTLVGEIESAPAAGGTPAVLDPND